MTVFRAATLRTFAIHAGAKELIGFALGLPLLKAIICQNIFAQLHRSS